MDNTWLFNCNDYVDVIQKRIRLEGGARGYKATLARAANCQPAYFSQVLSSHASLTLEQAVGLCDFWVFSELETEYFMTLVTLSRAGTPALSKKLQKKLSQLKEQSTAIKQKLQPSVNQPERAVNYYLDWTVSAVHIILTIPEFNEAKTIAKKLRIEEARVLKALSILHDLGIAEQKSNHWILTSKNLHASQETLFASLHHRNWRDQGKEKLPTEDTKQNLHYTAVVSLSKEDFIKVRKITKEMISQSREVIKSSKEEILSCMTLDWFEI